MLFQYFGVLTYTPELVEALNTGLLENGSELEVEIRGCSIEAVERIVAEVKKMIAGEKGDDLHFVNAPLVNIIMIRCLRTVSLGRYQDSPAFRWSYVHLDPAAF